MQRYENQPFAILGVNTDGDADEYRGLREELGVTWRNAFEGSTAGPVASEWGVTAYPTLYLLDAEGRIRYRDSRGEQLGEHVALLMAELEEDSVESPNSGALKALSSFDDLNAEYEIANSAWETSWRELSGKERRDARKLDPSAEFLVRFEALSNTGDGRAKLWIAEHLAAATDLRSKQLRSSLEGLFSELVTGFGDGELAGPIADALIGSAGKKVERVRRTELFELLLSNSGERAVKAKCMGAAIKLLSSRKATDEEQARASVLEALLLADYMDTSEGIKVWGDLNKGVFEGVGKVAPNFPAIDTDGDSFTLADYKGQVVMLDFWGFW